MRIFFSFLVAAMPFFSAHSAWAKDTVLSCTYDDYIIMEKWGEETTYHKYIVNTEHILSIDFENNEITELMTDFKYKITEYDSYSIKFTEYVEGTNNVYYINRTNGIYNIEVYEEDKMTMYGKGKCEVAKSLF